jgi:hypothetical protein
MCLVVPRVTGRPVPVLAIVNPKIALINVLLPAPVLPITSELKRPNSPTTVTWARRRE